MDPNLLDILSNSNKDIDNQKLMDYLHGKLSAAERHEVEKTLLDSDLETEALEGLQAMPDPTRLNDYVNDINRQLQQHLEQRNPRREKRRVKNMGWVLISATIILLICIIAFLTWYWKHREQKSSNPPPKTAIRLKAGPDFQELTI